MMRSPSMLELDVVAEAAAGRADGIVDDPRVRGRIVGAHRRSSLDAPRKVASRCLESKAAAGRHAGSSYIPGPPDRHRGARRSAGCSDPEHVAAIASAIRSLADSVVWQ